ncbi:MAG: formylglycine-generating enzyme family protein [Planctomycetota bacterium]
MLRITLRTIAIALVALPVLAAPSLQRGDEAGPPGTKLIKGGRTTIGAELKEIEAIVAGSSIEWNHREPYLGETPQHKLVVDDFYLGITEVTVEQYGTFVNATGHRPPIDFADEAVLEATLAFNEEQRRLGQEAQLAGDKFETTKFDRDAWWQANWQEAKWSVPAKRLAHPVVNVDFNDVLAYCEWAGVRPMTEFEYQRAVRGNTDRPYPWGDEWEPENAAFVKLGRADALPVGQFPGGAVDGIYDLAGNVWEWTSSRYTAFPKYEPKRLKTGKGKQAIETLVQTPFDADKRVGVGGSIGTSHYALRASVRQGLIRKQSVTQIGFRIAASATRGLDLAERVWANDVRQNVLGEVEPWLTASAILERWTSESGEVEVDGYRVITGYDDLLYVPIKKLADSANLGDLVAKTVASGPVLIGLLHTSVPTIEPALEPGTYFIGWRAKGEYEPPVVEEPVEEVDGKQPSLSRQSGQDEGAIEWWQTSGFDPSVHQWFVFDSQGVPLVAFPAREPSKERIKPGVVSVLRYEAWEPPAKVAKDAPPPVPLDRVVLRAVVPPRVGSNGLAFHFEVKLTPGLVDATWR